MNGVFKRFKVRDQAFLSLGVHPTLRYRMSSHTETERWPTINLHLGSRTEASQSTINHCLVWINNNRDFYCSSLVKIFSCHVLLPSHDQVSSETKAMSFLERSLLHQILFFLSHLVHPHFMSTKLFCGALNKKILSYQHFRWFNQYKIFSKGWSNHHPPQLRPHLNCLMQMHSVFVSVHFRWAPTIIHQRRSIRTTNASIMSSNMVSSRCSSKKRRKPSSDRE